MLVKIARIASLVVVLALLGALGVCGRGGAPKSAGSTSASALPPPAPRPTARPRVPIIDAHVHLSSTGTDRLAQLMERYGFDHVVNLSGGTPINGLDRQLAAAQKAHGKVTVFASLAYEQIAAPDYGARMAQLIRIAHSMGARGVKIAKVLGLGLVDRSRKLVPIDDPGLDPAFAAAGELHMPVAIHSGDPKAFWAKADEKNERRAELLAHPGWALHGEPVPSFDEIQAALERRIARHPKTTFIAVHFGNDAEDPDRVATLLRKYPNLTIDTAARIPEMGRHPPEKMRAFFIEFQDRILFGSDLGVGPAPEPLFLGSSGADPPTDREEKLFFSATHRYFETADRDFEHPTPIQGLWKISGISLPPEVLEKVYWRNAARLLDIQLTR